MLAGSKGEGEGLVRHLERAADLADEHNSPAGRCEALARLAMEAAKLGTEQNDLRLLERADAAAAEILDLVRTLPGHLPWEAMARAASSLVAHTQGRSHDAAEAARSALGILEPRLNRTHYLDVLWAVGRALIAAGAPESEDLVREIHEDLVHVDQTIVDQAVKARWFAVPMHRELAEMAAYEPAEMSPGPEPLPEGLEEGELEILRLLTSGSNDEEIATGLNAHEQDVHQRVSGLLLKLGVSSRLAATEYAVKAGIL
jgi:ATP/maltotriose-dependent transcriptional regulator MalT